MKVLVIDLEERATKRRFAAQPFVDHHRERILIAGRARLPPDLFGSHVKRCTGWLLSRERFYRLLDDRDAKITQHHLVLCVQEHVLRFDIAMDQALLVRIV